MTEKIWRLFYFSTGQRWTPSDQKRSYRSEKAALREARAMEREFCGIMKYTAIPGTVQKDGSITWPKEWPRP
jgi:hypothetical protein